MAKNKLNPETKSNFLTAALVIVFGAFVIYLTHTYLKIEVCGMFDILCAFNNIAAIGLMGFFYFLGGLIILSGVLIALGGFNLVKMFFVSAAILIFVVIYWFIPEPTDVVLFFGWLDEVAVTLVGMWLIYNQIKSGDLAGAVESKLKYSK